jgi:hypothetical protein
MNNKITTMLFLTLIKGIDNWHVSVAIAIRKGTKSQSVAIQTALGWVLFGFASSRTKPIDSLYHASSIETVNPRSELEELIKAQYKLDAIGITKHEGLTTPMINVRLINILDRTARRLPSGRFEVGLLWKADRLTAPHCQGSKVWNWTTNEPEAVASLPDDLLSDTVNNIIQDVDLCEDAVCSFYQAPSPDTSHAQL